MKAYKQINLSFEYRVVFSYALVLCFISFFIMLTPALAQKDSQPKNDKPEVRIDLQKEFDDLGNMIFFDSVFTWSWNGQDFPAEKLDSIFKNLNNGFENFSYNYKLHFKDYLNDSKDISYFNFDDLDQLLDKNFNFDEFFPSDEYLKNFQFDNEEFKDRFRQYQEEHQQLIEKYFKHPYNSEEDETKREPNNYLPGNKKSKESDAGKV